MHRVSADQHVRKHLFGNVRFVIRARGYRDAEKQVLAGIAEHLVIYDIDVFKPLFRRPVGEFEHVPPDRARLAVLPGIALDHEIAHHHVGGETEFHRAAAALEMRPRVFVVVAAEGNGFIFLPLEVFKIQIALERIAAAETYAVPRF